MRKQLLILMLLLVTNLAPVSSRPISLRAKTFQHGSIRMPSATRVSADYDNEIVTLNVTGYTGSVQVYVSDSQGNVVGYTISSIVNRGNVTLDLGALPEGSYYLSIALDNSSYYGEFEA